MPFFTTKRGNIQYELLPEYRERYGADGMLEIVQTAVVPWNTRKQFLRAILPDVSIGPRIIGDDIEITRVFNTPTAEKIIYERRALLRDLPEPHPYLNRSAVETNRIFAVGAETQEGLGWPARQLSTLPAPANQEMLFSAGRIPFVADGKAKVSVIFRALPYIADVADGLTNIPGKSEAARYVSRQGFAAGENQSYVGGAGTGTGFTTAIFMNPEGGNLLTGIVSTATTQQMIKRHGKMQLAYTWHMVPVIPRAAQRMMGMVNAELEIGQDPSQKAIFIREQIRPGTMLYITNEVSKPYFTISGMMVVDITYCLIYRAEWARKTKGTLFAHGHNSFYAPNRSAYLRIGARGPLNIAHVFPAGDDPPALSPNTTVPEMARGLYDYGFLENLFKIDGASILGVSPPEDAKLPTFVRSTIP